MYSCIQRQFSHLLYLLHTICALYEQTFTYTCNDKCTTVYCDACLNLHTIPHYFCRLIFHVRSCDFILEICERLCNSCTGPPHALNACFQCALCPCFSAVPGVPPVQVYSHRPPPPTSGTTSNRHLALHVLHVNHAHTFFYHGWRQGLYLLLKQLLTQA